MKLNTVIYILLFIVLGLFICYGILQFNKSKKVIESFFGLKKRFNSPCVGSHFFHADKCPRDYKHKYASPNSTPSGVCCNYFPEKTNFNVIQCVKGVYRPLSKKCNDNELETSTPPNGVAGICCIRKTQKQTQTQKRNTKPTQKQFSGFKKKPTKR